MKPRTHPSGSVRNARMRTILTGVATAGLLTSGAALAVPAAAAVGGTVTAHVQTLGGTALNGICLDVLNPGPKNSPLDIVVETAPSDLTGLITQANIPAGSYVGFFRDCGNADPNYVSRFYGNAYDESKATPISITDSATTHLGHHLIDLGGTATGTLSDPVAGAPAVNVSVTAWTATGHLLAEDYANPACTDDLGNWTIPALPTSGVKFEFGNAPFYECGGDLPYKDQFYAGATNYASANVVSLSPDATATVSATLTRAYAVTPTITSITFTGSVDAPTLTVRGTTFGARPRGKPTACPTPTGDDGLVFARGALYLQDNTGGWAAGFGGDCIGLIVNSYSTTKIVFTLGAWYQQVGQPDDNFNLDAGDDVSLTVRGTTTNDTVSYGP